MKQKERETMAEKEKFNFRVHLSGKKYIIGNGYGYWIVSETPRKNKKGEDEVYRKRLSGYHSDLVSLMDSYFEQTLKKAEIDGEIEDLVKLIIKTRKEIKSWWNKAKGAFE